MAAVFICGVWGIVGSEWQARKMGEEAGWREGERQKQILRLTTPEPTPQSFALRGPWYVRGPRSLRMTSFKFYGELRGRRFRKDKSRFFDSPPPNLPHKLCSAGPLVRSGPRSLRMTSYNFYGELRGGDGGGDGGAIQVAH